MIRFERPSDMRATFEDRATPQRDALVGMVSSDGSPDLRRIREHLEDHPLWRDYKGAFLAAQHRKCGYCEAGIITSYGDVEHYRPKNAVHRSIVTPGEEREDANNVSGRKFGDGGESGYWWLAYDWDNYLAACEICNRAWKRTLFPLANAPGRGPREGDEGIEQPLLLNPYGDRDPADHLAFGPEGTVEPFEGSDFGRASIDTCGLDRPSLCLARREKARQAYRLLQKVDESATHGDRREHLRDLYELGNPENVHAGMVRAICWQTLGLRWEELSAALA